LKDHIPALTLLLAGGLLLSGCSSMLERSYSSTVTHVDYAVMEDDAVLRAESYQGLVNSILYYVKEHSPVGSIRLYQDAGDVEADLERACQEVMEQDPLAAYTVRELTYRHTRVLTYYEVDVNIAYRHTAAEVEAIRSVSGLPDLRVELERMVAEGQEHAVFSTFYFSGDKDLVDQLILLAWYGQPTRCFSAGGAPLEWDVTLYPESGERRMVEITASWDTTSDQAADYERRLEAAAEELLNANPPAGMDYTGAELVGLVKAAAGPYDDGGANTALAALSGMPTSDIGRLLAMEYLCQRVGVEVFPVVEEDDPSRLWLILATADGYRHLLPQSLRGNDGAETEGFRVYTDEELSALGDYTWSPILYPACGDGVGDRSAPPEA